MAQILRTSAAKSIQKFDDYQTGQNAVLFAKTKVID